MDLIHAELTSQEMLTPYLGIFKFKPEKHFDFLPGQYVTLGVRRQGLTGPGVREKEGIGMVLRPYSIASSPDEEVIELIVTWVQRDGRRLDEWGVLTTELFEPQSEQEYVFLSRPKGRFLLPEDIRDVIMVATSTGIAPFISILRAAHSKSTDRRYFIIHGVSKHSDLAYRKELTSYKDRNVHYVRTISREPCQECESHYVEEYFVNRDGTSGRLSMEEVEHAVKNGKTEDTKIETLLGKSLTPENATIMLCGNPAMIEHIKHIAVEKQFRVHQDLIVESYW